MKVLDDFDFTPRELEQNEELDVVAWAENNGWIVRKMQYVGRRSCPDRYFFGYGLIIPIEMKKSTGRLSKGQTEEFKRLDAVGVKVHVFYSGDAAITFLKSRMPA